jgi:hypothetical protein
MPLHWSPTRLLFFVLLATLSVGCTSQLSANPDGGAAFPTPGRAVFTKKQWNGTRILICEGGPNDAVCYEKPN